MEMKMSNKKNGIASDQQKANTHHGVIVHESAELSQLKQRMEREIQQNALEAARYLGKAVAYGEAIQLFHIQTQSYLTVARESAEMQKDCLKLSIDKQGSKYSHFSLLPYFNYQKDGDLIKLTDKIRLWNRKSQQFIHLSYYRFGGSLSDSQIQQTSTIGRYDSSIKDVNYSQIAMEAVKNNNNSKKYSYDNRREVNMSASSAFSRWHIRIFSSWTTVSEEKNLKAGDIIRIYHKELNGFLSSNEKTGRCKLYKRMEKPINDESVSEPLSSEKSFKSFALDGASSKSMTSIGNQLSKASESSAGDILISNTYEDLPCQTLWEIEMVDTTKGGELKWNSLYRLRNVSTGYYLVTKPASDEDDLKEKEIEENENLVVNHSSEYRLKTESSSTSGSSQPSMELLIEDTSAREKPSLHIPTPTPQKKKNTKRENTWNLFTESIENCKDSSSTLFSLEDATFSQESDVMGRSGQFRLKHHQTGTWLHAMKSSESSQYSPVCSISTMLEQDVLTCYPTKRSEVDDLFIVQGYLPVLKFYHAKLIDNQVTKQDTKLFINVLSSCIRFCTTSDETDPLIRGGIPNKQIQTLMREKGIISTVMDILIIIFTKSYISVEDITFINERPEKHHYFDVVQYGYRFIRQAVLMHEVNGLYMAQYINFIQSNIEHSISASEALLQILSNNFSLLNKITEDQIDFFIKLLFDIQEGTNTSGKSAASSSNSTRKEVPKSNFKQYAKTTNSLKKAVYLSFLTSLIICEGKTVVKNQKYISNLLFSTYKDQMLKVFLIPRVRKTDDKVVIDVNHDEIDLVSFTKSATDDSNAMYSKPNFEKLVFFQEEIRLFAALCNGSSESTEVTRQSVTDLFSYNIVYRCIVDPNLTSAVKTSFVTLLMHCFVDTEKKEKRILVDLTRKISTLSAKGNQEHMTRELIEIKDFLRVYFKDNPSLDLGLENRDVNNFMYALVQLCRSMLEFGIYVLRDFEDTDLLVSLFNILRGDNDKRNGVLLKDEERFKYSEDSVTVTNIKIEIAKIFHMLLDLSLDKRITKFLQFFWLKYSDEQINTVLKEEDSNEVAQTSAEFVKQEILRKKELKKILNELDSKEHYVLREIFEKDLPFAKMDRFDLKLLSLTNYENQELSTICLRLLMRKFRSANELSDSLPRVELIISREMARSYDHLRKQTVELRGIFGYGRSNYIGARYISEYEVKKSIKVLDEILKDLGSNGQKSQRIVRNLQIYDIVLSVLRKDWIVPTEVQEKCLKVLIEFVKGNVENQKLMFPYLEFLMRMIGEHKRLNKYIVSLLCEIVKNNRPLCSTIEEKHIEQYIDIIAEQRSAFMLMFLRTILATHNGSPIKRNQSLITKYLLERKKDVVILYKDEEGLRERNIRIGKEEHKKEPDGILNYHIALLHLMAKAADGKNRESEQRLQTLYSYEELLEQVVSPFTLSLIRNPLVKIIDEVYINVEKVNFDNHEEKKKTTTNIHHPLLYKMFSKMIRELEFIEMSSSLNLEKDIVSNPVTPTPSRAPTTPTSSRTASLLEAVNNTPSTIRQSRALTANTPNNRLSRNYANARAIVTEEETERLYADNYYIFEIMIPIIQNYFHLHFPPPNVTQEQLDIAEELLTKIIELQKHTANPEQRDKIFKCVTAMWKKSMNPSCQIAITKFVSGKSAKAKVVRTCIQTTSIIEQDEFIHKVYKAYLKKRIMQKLVKYSQFHELAILYQKYDGFVKVLVRVLRNLNVSSFNDHTLLDVGLFGLEILKEIVQFQNASKEQDLQTRLMIKAIEGRSITTLDYVDKKLPLVVVELLTSNNSEIVKSAIELGKLILYKGDKSIQDEFHRILTKSDSSEFFISLRDRIRLSKREIKDRKNYLKKKRDKENAMNNQRQKQEISKVRLGLKDADGENNTTQISEDDQSNEEFVERGHIQSLFEFLRLICEGHNTNIQSLLLSQPRNSLTVNLVHESVEYLIALEKKIDSDNVQIAIQGFKTLTEMIQGPSIMIQNFIGTSPKFYARLVNEITSKSYEDGLLLKQQELELKKEVTLTLISLLEGSENKTVLEFMRFSLSLDEIQSTLLFCAKFLQALSEIRSEKLEPSDEVDDVQRRIRKDFDTHFLYAATRNRKNPVVVEDYIRNMLPKIKEQSEDLGMHIFFLLNIFRDGEQEQIRRTSRSVFLSMEDEMKLSTVTTFISQHQDVLSIFSKQTGTIEVLRNNKIEKLYFPKPKICNNLIDKARSTYINSLDVMTPEEKVRTLYNDTFSRFYVEMHHYETMKNKPKETKNKWKSIADDEEDYGVVEEKASFLIPSIAHLRRSVKKQKQITFNKQSLDHTATYEYIANWWDYLRILSFIFNIIINIIVLGTFKRVYSVNTASDIPVPGDESFDPMSHNKYPSPRTLAGNIVLNIFGITQLATSVLLTILYCKFFITLEVKKRFKLKKRETWDSIPRDREFYLKFVYYVLQDSQVWFLSLFFILSLLGLLISPIVYSILLFDIVFRFKSLNDVIKAVISNGKRLFFAGMLLLIAMFFFGVLYFSWFYTDFALGADGTETCETVLACFVTMFDYGFRAEASWENLYLPNPGVGRAALDLSFTLIVIVFL